MEIETRNSKLENRNLRLETFFKARAASEFSVMSLVIANMPAPDLVESAWLVAVICAVAGDGKSAGSVYRPPEVIVPSVAFPPGLPLTLQLTAESVVLVTVAVKVARAPSTMDPYTSITGGGKGGVSAPRAPHPSVQAPSANSAMGTAVVVVDLFPLIGERDRMPSQKQAQGQRKEEGIEVRD